MNPFSLLISFAPWIVFKILLSIPFEEPLLRVKIALAAAFLIWFFQAKKATKGVIFWGTAFFFSFSVPMVFLMNNIWFASNLGFISQMTLGGLVWGSILFRRPFTIDYAKKFVPEEYWKHPLFLRKNNIISGAWGLYFLVGIAITVTQRYYAPPAFLLNAIEIAVIASVIIFTSVSSKEHSES